MTVVPDDLELAEQGGQQLTTGAEASIAFERQFLLPGNHPTPMSSGEPTVAIALDAYEAYMKATMLITS